MKYFTLLILLFSFRQVSGQDTLRTQDLTSAGDTFVLSIGTPFTGIDAVATGPNYNWDFSQLGRSGQRIDTILDPNSTNILFSFYFINSPLNSNRSNQATRGQNFQLGVVGVTDVFNYYYNSSSEFTQTGFGAVVNGVPLPIAYSPHDVLYRFPLKYGDADSVSYGYEIDLTSTLGLYYRVNRNRRNIVDGWGSLTTPFGTFDVLRVKSTITERDSVYIDSLGFGVNLPAITTKEYKWMGAGFGLPLLQLNTSATDNITQILYQDSVRVNGLSKLNGFISEPVIFPNPASNYVLISYSLNRPSETSIVLFSAEGKLVNAINDYKSLQGENRVIMDLKGLNLAPGNYFIRIKSGKDFYSKQLQIN